MGNAPESTLRQTFDEIASFRAAFKTLYPNLRLDSPVPIRVVLFPDDLALRRYAPRDDRGRPQNFVGGYFNSGPDLNVIALGGRGSELVFHEFAHSFLTRNLRSLPGWLHEGLAEFHSTFDADWKKGKSLIGQVPRHRLKSLRNLSFVPLEEIVSATSGDMARYWRDPRRIEMFYAESWALVHYLMLGRGPTAHESFARFVTSMEQGAQVHQALREAYDTDLTSIERELRRYVARPVFPALFFELVRQDDSAAKIERMTEADVRQVQGDLLLRMGAPDEAEEDLAEALALNPQHLASRIALAQVRVAQDRLPEGTAALEEIVKSEPANFGAVYHLASVLLEAGRPREALDLFDRATKMNGASAHAWLGASLSSLALDQAARAEKAMSVVRQLESSPGWYQARAYAALRLGLDATAAADAKKYLAEAGWDGNTVYPAFVAAIAHWRLNQPNEATAILEQSRKATNTTDWTNVVIDFLQDRLGPEAFLSKAKGNGEKTEAHTYIGFKSAIAGRREEALAHFRWVRDEGARNYVEFEMARGELRRLEHSRP